MRIQYMAFHVTEERNNIPIDGNIEIWGEGIFWKQIWIITHTLHQNKLQINWKLSPPRFGGKFWILVIHIQVKKHKDRSVYMKVKNLHKHTLMHIINKTNKQPGGEKDSQLWRRLTLWELFQIYKKNASTA